MITVITAVIICSVIYSLGLYQNNSIIRYWKKEYEKQYFTSKQLRIQLQIRNIDCMFGYRCLQLMYKYEDDKELILSKYEKLHRVILNEVDSDFKLRYVKRIDNLINKHL